MKIIDLTLPLNNNLPVFPGDPPVNIHQIQSFEEDGWNMNRLEINGHDGTHVNAQIHGMAKGKNLDDYKLEDFIGEAVILESFDDIQPGVGLIVRDQNITMEQAQIIAERKLKFVGLAAEFEMDVNVEKFFFEKDILVFERIANTSQLPKKFIFHGAPLRITGGDGSPIRAYAIVEQ